MYIDYQEIGKTDLLFFSACSCVGSHETAALTDAQQPYALLYPSIRSDGELRLSVDAEELLVDGLLLCRGHLIDTRGLPLDEITFSYRDQNYTWRKNKEIWSLYIPICKVFLSKIEISYQDCRTSAALLCNNNKFTICYYAHDMRVLDVELLFHLCHRADPRVGSLIVCSVVDSTLFGIAYAPPICTRLSLSELGDALHALCRLGIFRTGHAYHVRDLQLDLIAHGSGRVEYRLTKNDTDTGT